MPELGQVGAQPVEDLLGALARADVAGVYAALADDATLAVPSLRSTLTGRETVAGAVDAVLRAFPDLRYLATSRYVAPGQVTDEAVLSGVRNGPWAELPPSGRPHSLQARVVLDHDGLRVTRLTVWADAGALRALVLDADASLTGAVPIVSALRATIPAGDPRLIVGSARDAARPAAPVTPDRPLRDEELNSAAAKAAALRVPMPRRRRRLLAVLAAVGMAGVAAAIVAWVARGALEAPVAPAKPVAVRTSAPVTPTPGRTPTPVKRTPEPGFTRKGNLITLNTDLTFDFGSARLTRQASAALREIMRQVRAEGRTGTITVNGFTDSTGGKAHNLELSRARAEAVAAVLEQGLAGTGIRVVSAGFGEERPKRPNTTDANKAANRRVEITVPGSA